MPRHIILPNRQIYDSSNMFTINVNENVRNRRKKSCTIDSSVPTKFFISHLDTENMDIVDIY